MLKLLIISLSLTIFSAPAAFAWTNICKNNESDVIWCNDLDKDVYAKIGNEWIKYAKVIGVAWRPKGTTIDTNPYKESPKDAYYYILETDNGFPPFLRYVNDDKIRVKPLQKD